VVVLRCFPQGAVRITRVDASVQVVEATARTTVEISLENATTRRQEAKLIVHLASEAVMSGFAYDGPGSGKGRCVSR
jgi:hypothetical protein